MLFSAGFSSALEVSWHIGDRVVTESLTEPAAATPPEYSSVMEIGGVECKALGFAIREGGEVVEDLGYIFSGNREFWLVYVEPTAYVRGADGAVSYVYSDSELDAAMLGAESETLLPCFAIRWQA